MAKREGGGEYSPALRRSGRQTNGAADDRASRSAREGLARRQTYSARFNPGGNDNSHRKDDSTMEMGRPTRILVDAFRLQRARINHNPLPGQ